MDQGISRRMRKNRFFGGVWVTYFCLATFFLLMTGIALNAEEAQEAPEEIVINNPVYKTDRKGSVVFTHSEHADGYVESCDACHHEYKDGETFGRRGSLLKSAPAVTIRPSGTVISES